MLLQMAIDGSSGGAQVAVEVAPDEAGVTVGVRDTATGLHLEGVPPELGGRVLDLAPYSGDAGLDRVHSSPKAVRLSFLATFSHMIGVDLTLDCDRSRGRTVPLRFGGKVQAAA